MCVTDLPLGDVAREVGDGVRDVVVGHGEDGQLRDGAVAPADTPRTLVDRRQVRVHVTLQGAERGEAGEGWWGHGGLSWAGALLGTLEVESGPFY